MGLRDRLATRDAGAAESDDLVSRFRERLLEEIDLEELSALEAPQRRARLERILGRLLSYEGPVLSTRERAQLIQRIVDESIGLGVLESLLADDTITEIMVNGPDDIFVERRGKIERVSARFASEQHLYQTIDRIVSTVNRRVDESSPMVDARLATGERVNVIIPPLALDGPTMTIRRFPTPFRLADLIQRGALDEPLSLLLGALVRSRCNILVSGGTGSGKTTFLNALSGLIPGSERIVTIEDAAELSLQQEHVVRLESRPANVEGAGSVTIRDLVRNSLRMRPDRIVVGEVRGGETLDMLQAMNTGHEGSLTTVHANGAADALGRLETLASMSDLDLPVDTLRDQINSAIDVIIHLERGSDGSRRVSEVRALVSARREDYRLETISRFVPPPFGSPAQTPGSFSHGLVPDALRERLRVAGEPVPAVYAAMNAGHP